MSSYVVYWQPGCTSCLRAKEFLTRHSIAFDSINVRLDPGAMDRLAALGARSIPVIARGTQWVYGQDIDEVAAFVGIAHDRTRLPPALLALRIESLLAAAARFTAQLPDGSLESLLPGRADRAAIDLAYHVAMIVSGFLDAARGGSLQFEYFERRPTGEQRERASVIAAQRRAAQELSAWWMDSAASLPAEVHTYYGTKPLAGVLERTAWHIAQHVRQLESLVSAAGVVPEGTLGDDELGGLPLPDGLWDREIGAS